jgi:poly(hydroxyalkanoate) depolymerase family esterase
MQPGMADVLRLTRAGRLAEATALIQRTLAGLPAADVSTAQDNRAGAPIDAEFRVVDASPAGRANGQFIDKIYSNTAGTIAYKLYVPGSYTGQAAPLVVMLHGCSQTALDFATGTRMNVFAENKTFLVAYPTQGTAANGSKCWNWFQDANQLRDVGEPSLIAGITRQIMKEYHIDERRVYVAGMSAGGAMAATMAATYPDLYAAVGVHSGLAYGAAYDLSSAFMAMQGTPQPARQLTRFIPLIAFHGDRDTTVAPVNTDHLLEQWLQAVNTRSGGGQRSIGDAKVERGQVASGHAYTRFIYHDRDGRAILEKWIIHQAGHGWSGGSSQASYTNSKGPDASAAMVRFFHEHSRGS